jgi:uncharacterized damage-inducible protein DinB
MTYYTSADMANAFRTVRKNTLQVAHDIPADQLHYRATPDTRSVAETLAHVAANTRWVHKVHGVDKVTTLSSEDFGRYIGEVNAYAATLSTREDLIRALETNGRAFADWLESLDEATLAERVLFAPPIQPASKTRFEMLLSAKEHEMHHRAQLMVIQRLLGIVPHLTAARLARQR